MFTITTLEERLNRIESSFMGYTAKILILEERINKLGESIDWLISQQENDREFFDVLREWKKKKDVE
jgi:hypothetical protein